MNRSFYLLVVMVALLAFGCSDGTDSGEVFTPESGHPDTWVNPAFLGTEGFHGSVVKGETSQQGTSRQIEPDGADLFATNCAACHGSDASGSIGPNIQGKTAADIQSAIDTVSAMAFLHGTLTPEQIQAAAKAYKVYYKKEPSDDPDYYLIDHSTFTYLVLPETGFVDYFKRDVTPADMASRTACFIKAAS